MVQSVDDYFIERVTVNHMIMYRLLVLELFESIKLCKLLVLDRST